MSIKNDKNILKYQEYFKEEFEELQKELNKSKIYAELIDSEIDKFRSLPTGSKGASLYMVENVKNAISLQSQRQSLIKDLFNMKKSFIDYNNKNKDDDDSSGLMKELRNFLSDKKDALTEKTEVPAEVEEDLDDYIDKQIDEHRED